MKGDVLTGPVRVSGVAKLITEGPGGQAHGRSGRGLVSGESLRFKNSTVEG
jgi:hypothetical protein